MQVQNSFEATKSGDIYVVPTPIGNLEDMTYRAVNILKSVNVIAAEDTRNTKKLLNHYEIETPLTSYHEHNKQEKTDKLIKRVKAGEQIAIVSDAGMPAISDPGVELVQAAIQADVNVIVLPGANAALCGLVGSGLPTDNFYFHGFLPRKKKEKLATFESLKQTQATILFYESPYRVKDTLTAMYEQLGNRKIALARELTKRFEEYVRGDLEEIIPWLSDRELKGEFVIVLEGAKEEELIASEVWWENFEIKEHVNYYIEKSGYSNKEAIKQTALDRKQPKREIYQAYHVD